MSGYKEGGLEERFIVCRVDGKPIPDDRRYLILDYSGSDPYALEALHFYANAVSRENPKFGQQLLEALNDPQNAAPQHRG